MGDMSWFRNRRYTRGCDVPKTMRRARRLFQKNLAASKVNNEDDPREYLRPSRRLEQ